MHNNVKLEIRLFVMNFNGMFSLRVLLDTVYGFVRSLGDCRPSKYRSGLVDLLLTHGHANTKGFGLTSLSGVRRGFMPSQLKTKNSSLSSSIKIKFQSSRSPYPTMNFKCQLKNFLTLVC